MRRDLLRRVARLEARQSFSERRLRRLAERLCIDPQRLSMVAKGHEAELAKHLGEDGTITWEGFVLVLKLLGIDPTRRHASSTHHKHIDPGTRPDNANITRNNAKNNADLTRI